MKYRWAWVLVVCWLTVSGAWASPGVPCHHLHSSSSAAAAYSRCLTLYYAGTLAGAVAAGQEAVRLEPDCALAHAALSRALLRAGQREAALQQGDLAQARLAAADDREQRVVQAWLWHLQSIRSKGVTAAKALDSERESLNTAIVLYPDDEDIWAWRGDASEAAVGAAPFRILLHLDANHPLGKVWKRPVTQAPALPADKNFLIISKPTEPPRLMDGLGNLTHAITTSDPMAQKYYEQGLRCFHAYVTPSNVKNSAAVCYQQALALDPKCAMAQWGLSFCISDTDKVSRLGLARSAYALAVEHGTDKERRFCAARVLELSGAEHRDEFLETLDGAIAAYPEDIELWIWRGKVYGDYGIATEEPSAGVLAGMAFELAAWQLHPEHPSPNHELIHDYEAIDRPVLGWKYTVGFRNAAPNMPHAHHMQAHLAMRLGRWADALDATEMAWRKSQEGYPELDPSHHLYAYCLTLIHEGRFQQLQQVAGNLQDNLFWTRMLRLQGNPKGLVEWSRQHQTVTPDHVYAAALAALEQGDVTAAVRLENQLHTMTDEKKLSVYNYAEVRARCLIAGGKADEGMALFRNTAAQAVADANLHYFGGGGYFPEAWGESALRLQRLDEAQLAFSEALAHDHGSIVGALGLQVVWERRGNSQMANQYAALAAEIWKRADAGALQRLLEHLRALAPARNG